MNVIKDFITQHSYDIHSFNPKVKQKLTQHTSPHRHHRLRPLTSAPKQRISMGFVLSGSAFHSNKQ